MWEEIPREEERMDSSLSCVHTFAAKRNPLRVLIVISALQEVSDRAKNTEGIRNGVALENEGERKRESLKCMFVWNVWENEKGRLVMERYFTDANEPNGEGDKRKERRGRRRKETTEERDGKGEMRV